MMKGRFSDIGILIDPYFNLDGRIKEKPEDFIVEEIFKGKILRVRYSLLEKIKDFFIFLSKKRKYFHFTVVKRNIGTFDIVEILRRKGIKKVWYCGLKDKRALTAQRFCVYSKYWRKIISIKGKDFFFKDYSFEDFKIKRGMNDGNHFIIKVRKEVKEEDVKILEKFREMCSKGLPNFFGPQRFGIKRPNNHKIGYLIIKRRWEDACFEFLARVYNEKGIERKIREFCEKNWGKWKEIYEMFKKVRELWVERIVLRELMKGRNFEEALMKIPKDILRLWVDAYQSYLFNKLLSILILRGEKIPKKLPLVSYNTKLERWENIREYIEEILKSENISLDEFRIRKRIRPKTKIRNSFMFPKKFRYKIEKDGIVLEFCLGRGEYASVVLYFLGIS